jgi:hypothetical protein
MNIIDLYKRFLAMLRDVSFEDISDGFVYKPDDLVKDFFKSSIANPHPVPDNTGYYTSLLEKIKLYEELSPRIVLLMMVAHSELVDEWVE